MARSTARINFKAKAFVDRPGVIAKVKRWQLARLSRTGAYASGAMKKQIRPALKGRKKDRTVELVPMPGELPVKWRNRWALNQKPILCYVPVKGPVVDARTQKRVNKNLAIRARMAVAGGRRGQGEGQPPRNKTGKLKRHIYFDIDTSKPSVVIGPEPFPRQPQMVRRVSVPQLLNRGGIEIILGTPVRYGPRPFVETILKPAIKMLRGQIKRYPVKNR